MDYIFVSPPYRPQGVRVTGVIADVESVPDNCSDQARKEWVLKATDQAQRLMLEFYGLVPDLASLVRQQEYYLLRIRDRIPCSNNAALGKCAFHGNEQYKLSEVHP